MVILVGASVVNLINYAYQLFMGRVLGPADYGVLGAIFSIIYIVTFSFGAIRTAITRVVSKYAAIENYGKIKAIVVFSFEKLSLYGFIGLMLISALFYFMAPLLKIDYPLLLLTSVFLFLSLLSPIPQGVISGLQRFNTLNIVSVAGAFFKLLFGVLFVLLGYSVFGAMIGLNISQLLIIVFSLWAVHKIFGYEKEEISKVSLFDYSLPVFIGLTLMNLFVNLDVLFVKHYFSAVDAGFYAAASIIGKAILFSSSAFLTVMFPKVSFNYHKGEGSSKILVSTLFYTFIISLAAIILYFSIPTFISHLFFGEEYKISSFIGLFGVAVALFSMSNVIFTYNLAIEKTRFVYMLLPLLTIEIIGFIMFHNSLKEIIQVLLVTNVLLLLYLTFISRKELGFNTI